MPKGLRGFQKGHKTFKGVEKSWFKKGDIRLMGENNPAKKLEVRIKISNGRKGKSNPKEERKIFGERMSKRYASGELVIWNKNLTKKNDERVKKSSEKMAISKLGIPSSKKGKSFEEMYGVDKARFLSAEHGKKITKKYLEGSFNYKGYFFSQKNNAMIGYRSSYELMAIRIMEQMTPILNYSYEKLSIPYVDEHGIERHTIPDFVINYDNGVKEVVEVKPEFKIKNNLHNTSLKLAAMQKYCDENGYKFSIWSEKDIALPIT